MKTPRGFKLAGVHSGIKRKPGKEDVTLIVADRPAVTAGVYTTNLVYAAPVAIDRARTPSSDIRAIVVNSGNANACTGQKGLEDAHEMCRLAAEAIGAKPEQVLVMSTGIIGVLMPMENIAAGVKLAAGQLGSDDASFDAASRGILTTDKSAKVSSSVQTIGGREIRFAGMAKGAGMIGPRMATMLGVMLTDAPLTQADAQAILADVADQTFNCISVEGHMSTNDTLLLVASGAVGGAPLAGADLAAFKRLLLETCTELCKQIPSDGEGATHLLCIEVRGCRTRDEARQIARTVADSALVKTAITGGDPNWGRIVSAAGYAGVPLDASKINLTVNGHSLYRQGAPVKFVAKEVSDAIKAKFETDIVLEFGEGNASIRFWSSDLTVEYVKFNADYST